MIDINKKYRTRDGQEARIYATDGEHGELVHGAVNHSQHGWQSMIWFANGNYLDDEESDFDLIKVSHRHKRTVWLNLYDCHTLLYESRKDSDSMSADGRIACIKVELDFEEGEGL